VADNGYGNGDFRLGTLSQSSISMAMTPEERQREDNQNDGPIFDSPIQQRHDFTPKTAQEILKQDIHTASPGTP
jgi:hypothetical protein